MSVTKDAFRVHGKFYVDDNSDPESPAVLAADFYTRATPISVALCNTKFNEQTNAEEHTVVKKFVISTDLIATDPTLNQSLVWPEDIVAASITEQAPNELFNSGDAFGVELNLIYDGPIFDPVLFDKATFVITNGEQVVNVAEAYYQSIKIPIQTPVSNFAVGSAMVGLAAGLLVA